MQPAQESSPPAPAPPAGDPLTQPLIDFLPSSVLPPRTPSTTTPAPFPEQPAADPTWPCTACEARNPLSADHCGSCGAAFLATVAAESRSALVLPVVGDLMKLSRAQRILGALAVVVVLVLFVALVTLLLAKRPPAPAHNDNTGNVPTTQQTSGIV